MAGEDLSSGMYRPCIEVASQRFDEADQAGPGLGNPEQCGSLHDMDDSQLLGAPVAVAGDAAVATAAAAPQVSSTVPVGVKGAAHTAIVMAGEKRKRGRPPKGQGPAPKPPPPKRMKEEEDVCFICFDGGSLVLCDRKGCPKAYHPSCIKRDEAFFQSKAKWNCGWHICSVCQKAAHYMCYTCTYSLCKGCTKDADYVCVRGNKGFCSTCMRTVMLIENKDLAAKEMVQVDFDDKTSWEYLFKVYWILLKDKLSLTLNELLHAKSPWKPAVPVNWKSQLPDIHSVANLGKTSAWNDSSLILEKPKEQVGSPIEKSLQTEHPAFTGSSENVESCKNGEELELLANEDLKKTEKSNIIADINLNGCSEWASKELLEFVAHMRNGDMSTLSQFDVQALLLEYIKRNNLRDPRRKSQIICDARLSSLFGKPRVGHIEMLKLLEFHFLLKDSKSTAFIPAGIVGNVASHAESNDCDLNSPVMNQNKKRKGRRKSEEKAPQAKLDEYAAVDIHNINLIYLKRSLMESLIEDQETFCHKVVGAIVRIRISSNDQKQDIYRLVQVVGTSKVAVPYKLGDATTDVVVEVLNLNKKEAVSIDTISNQDFSEEECRRLRQSIRCGLVKRFTVGEIQKKAMELQAVGLNNRLEAEILRLNHLRDRASEKGRKKELRECVEKIQLLKTPEERQRRLEEIPEIHADKTMDPNYESEEEHGGKQDKQLMAEHPGSNQNGSKPIPVKKKFREDGHSWNELRMDERKDTFGSNSLDKQVDHTNVASSISGGTLNHTVTRTGLGTLTTAASSIIEALFSDDVELDKMWHYRDPNGKVQGPFSMMQLRKWSTTGFFPPDMQIWTNDEHNDSVLLTDALSGQFHNNSQSSGDAPFQSQQSSVISDNILHNHDVGRGGNDHGTCNNNERAPMNWHGNNVGGLQNGNNETFRTHDLHSAPLSQSSGLFEGRNSYEKSQEFSLLPSSSIGLNSGTHFDQTREHETDKLTDHRHVIQEACGTMLSLAISDHRKENDATSGSQAGQLSGQNWRSFPLKPSSVAGGSDPHFLSANKLDDQFENDLSLELPSPTPKGISIDLESGATKKQQSLPSCDHIQADIQVLPSPIPRPGAEDQKREAAEGKRSETSHFPAQESGPSWSSASSLVIGGQLPEIADELTGYSPTAKPSVEGDSGLVSISPLKRNETVGDHVATPTSDLDQLNHSSPSHPASGISGWQVMVGETIEFSTLAEESVSDLLAEVDAMESQSGLPSPTSAMKCGEVMSQGCRNDCFSSIEELSPTPDPGKSDAMSSTADIHLPGHSTVLDERIRVPRIDAFDPSRRSGGHSSTSSEGETKSTDFFVNQGEASPKVDPSAVNMVSQDMDGKSMARSSGYEAMDPSWRAGQQNHINRGRSIQGSSNWALNQATWGNQNTNHGAFNGNLVWDGQRRYGGERLASPRDWALQGGEQGIPKGRTSWSRQSFGGGGGGSGSGGYSRPPPRGQRICKFYESGHCKKGASCDYLHP